MSSERQSVLEHWLKFSDADVAANRSGVLSGSQSMRLLMSGIWRLIVGPPLVVGGVVVGLLVDTVLLAGLALVATAAGLYITWRGFAFIVDWRAGDVAFLTDGLRLRVERGKTTSYYADVGPVTKHLSRAAYEALPSATVHLYYAPSCRSLLSVEPSYTEEPKPPHPFGPDSAQVWDRLRWSWVLITIGVLGLGIGIHQLAAAHPARAVAIEGMVSNYVETHGKSTSRTIYMDDGNSYTPKDENSYSPPAPSWDSLVGQQVTLYVNAGTGDVLAVNVEGRLYATDWYLHPDDQKTFELYNGAITAVLALALGACGVLLVMRDRRIAPPTVRIGGLRSGALATTVALTVVVGVIGFIASVAGR